MLAKNLSMEGFQGSCVLASVLKAPYSKHASMRLHAISRTLGVCWTIADEKLNLGRGTIKRFEKLHLGCGPEGTSELKPPKSFFSLCSRSGTSSGWRKTSAWKGSKVLAALLRCREPHTVRHCMLSAERLVGAGSLLLNRETWGMAQKAHLNSNHQRDTCCGYLCAHCGSKLHLLLSFPPKLRKLHQRNS